MWQLQELKGALSNNLVYKTPFNQPGEGKSKWHRSLAHLFCAIMKAKKVFCKSFKCTGHGQFSGLYSAVITRRSMMGSFFPLQIHEPRNKAFVFLVELFSYANAFSCIDVGHVSENTLLSAIVWTITALNWNKSFTHIVPERLADKVCFSKSQSSLLNINFRLGRFQSSILLIREFKIPRRRRPRKRRLKSEFAFFQSHCDFSNSLTLSNASELFLSRIPKNHIQVQKKKGNLAVACLRPPSNVKLGIFLS